MASRRVARLAPWGVALAIALMGAALVVTAWWNHAAVRDASALLARGQGDSLVRALQIELASLGGQPTAAELTGLLDEYAGAGLRYLAVFDRDGRPAIEAGTSARADSPPASRPQQFETLSRDRIRVVSRGPRMHRFPPHGRPPMGHGPPPSFVIELEPVIARELLAASGRNFRIALLAAGMLIAVALVLVRWMLRQATLERARERDRRLASLGEMSAVLAHEIRNPLASLKGNAQLLAESLPDGQKSRQKAGRVVDEAIRLESLVNDLLEFARTGEIHREPTDPGQLLRTVAASAAAGSVEVDTSRAPATWSLDPARMREVLSNLVDNAIQAGGPVRASVSESGGALCFEVADGGAGVPEADVERIFEPFYSKRTHGTGLGLAVAKRVVELHKGSIRVSNVDGGGARFRVTIP